MTAALAQLIEETRELLFAQTYSEPNAEAWQLRSGQSIVIRDNKRKRKELPISRILPPCDRMHVHVQLKDGRTWCYDRYAQVELT